MSMNGKGRSHLQLLSIGWVRTICAGGVLEIDGQVSALFSTSTLISYRKRGLQTALLDWRLRCVKEHGSRLATIETDPD